MLNLFPWRKRLVRYPLTSVYLFIANNAIGSLIGHCGLELAAISLQCRAHSDLIQILLYRAEVNDIPFHFSKVYHISKS